jgi:hypothetical protein
MPASTPALRDARAGLVGLFPLGALEPVPDLQAVVVMDYQNVHLTAHELFAISAAPPRSGAPWVSLPEGASRTP